MMAQGNMILLSQIFALLLFNGASSTPTTVQFLRDYFAEKNVMITASLCWRKGDVMKLQHTLQTASTISSKQVSIHNSQVEEPRFFHHLSMDNYFLIDLRSCNSSKSLLNKVNNENLFRNPLKYLLLCDEDTHEKLVPILRNYSIYPFSDVVVAIVSETSTRLIQYYKVGMNTDLITEYYGQWSLHSGLTEYHRSPIGTRRKDLRQFQLKMDVIIKSNDTWDHLLDHRYPRVDSFTKQDFPIFDLLAQYVNASYELKGFESYGYLNETTGEFNGIIGHLRGHNSHLAGLAILFTPERFAAVDYMTFINPTWHRFLVRKPSTSYVRNIFIITFKWNVWLCCLAVLILFAPCTWMILNFEDNIGKVGGMTDGNHTMSDAALVSLEALCQQGTATETRSLSGRTIFLVLFTSFMAIYVAYSAYIVVLLQSTTNIDALKELLESRIAVGAEDTGYMRNYLEAPKSGVLKDIYRKKIYPDQYYTIVEGMKKVQGGNFAFHLRLAAGYDYVLKEFSAYDICGLQELPGYMEFLDGYSTLPKNSPYKEIFKIGLLKINEHGMRQRSVEMIYIKPKCYMQGASFQNVGIYDCYEIFIIWSCGVWIACVVCLLENILSRVSSVNARKQPERVVWFSKK